MAQWLTTRTIIEQQEVADTCDAFLKDYPRFEKLWLGITWLIARKGHELGAHRNINGSEYRLYVVAAAAEDLPEVTLLYTVEKDTITIYHIGIQIGQEEKSRSTIAKIPQNS